MPSFRKDMPLYAGLILLQQGSAKYQMLQFKQQMWREATLGLQFVQSLQENMDFNVDRFCRVCLDMM